jgi:hypothetical protein
MPGSSGVGAPGSAGAGQVLGTGATPGSWGVGSLWCAPGSGAVRV